MHAILKIDQNYSVTGKIEKYSPFLPNQNIRRAKQKLIKELNIHWCYLGIAKYASWENHDHTIITRNLQSGKKWCQYGGWKNG